AGQRLVKSLQFLDRLVGAANRLLDRALDVMCENALRAQERSHRGEILFELAAQQVRDGAGDLTEHQHSLGAVAFVHGFGLLDAAAACEGSSCGNATITQRAPAPQARGAVMVHCPICRHGNALRSPGFVARRLVYSSAISPVAEMTSGSF